MYLVLLLVGVGASASTTASAVTRESVRQPARGESQTSTRMWFWSRDYVQQTLRRNGITWSNGHDRVQVAKCSGLGKWIVTRGIRLFRDFHCYIDSHERPVYKVIFHVSGELRYRFTYARQQTEVTWWWPAQRAANALVNDGIRWSSGHQRIVGSSCSPSVHPLGFWAALLRALLLHCKTGPRCLIRNRLDVTARDAWHTTFRYLFRRAPATPVVTAPPVPSSNTTNQQLVNHHINNQLAVDIVLNDMMAQNQTMFGRSYAPHVNDSTLGSVGCASDPFVNTPFKSYGSC